MRRLRNRLHIVENEQKDVYGKEKNIRTRNTNCFLCQQQGEIMLEAALIFVPILLLLLMLLSLSFFFYQTALMTSVANEIAADIGKNYKFTELEMGQDTITLDDVTEARMFRMNFGKGFGKNSMEGKHKKRGANYAKWRVGLTTLGLDAEDVTVECEIKGSGVGRAYVEVKVSQKTGFFLSEILDFLGITEKNTMFSCTAYAECVDLMAYTSMVNFVEYGSGRLEVLNINSDTNLYSSVKELLGKFIQYIYCLFFVTSTIHNPPYYFRHFDVYHQLFLLILVIFYILFILCPHFHIILNSDS